MAASQNIPWLILFVAASALSVSCTSAPRNMEAIGAYYEYDFTTAREALRADAEMRNDEQVVLNNLRLGMAAMADGDPIESERTFGRVFDLLATAGLNEDRTTAAVLVHEGVRIWKGEPFEQALAYYEIAALYATLGDWENMRAAAVNSLFRLTDFGTDRFTGRVDQEHLVRRAARDPDYLEAGYTAVDTDFALGFLMEAIGADLSGLGGADPQFDAAVETNPELAPIVQTLRSRDYDTLLIVDYGKGPTKIAFGPDDALSRFDPQDYSGARITVSAAGTTLGTFDAVCDVNQMAVDHRWNNLEDVRRAKSAIGDVLIGGGVVAMSVGSHNRSDEAVLAGLGAILLGALTKSGAKADTRYLEFAPSEIFLVPLQLNQERDLRIVVESGGLTSMTLPDFVPGTPGQPRAVYLRLHGPDSPQPTWLAATRVQYGNDHTGVLPGDFPWVLGGRDVSTPSRETLQAYQQSGHLTDLVPSDLRDLYRQEGILIGSGAENRPEERKNPSFRHVLEGGRGLFTPHPYSMGYKRLMYSMFSPYHPRSELAQRLTEDIRDSAMAESEQTQTHTHTYRFRTSR